MDFSRLKSGQQRVQALKLGALAVLFSAIAGCGGSDSPSVPPPTVSSTAVGAPKYSQTLRFTVTGQHLDQGVTATSPACKTLTLSTTAPFVSSATEAYWLCSVAAVGNQALTVRRTADGSALATLPFIVPQPQVTMTLSNGLAVNGSIVITLAPDQAPITVDNFLQYVNAQFYDGTVFHRAQTGFVVQGGGYAAPIVAGTVPTHKTTNAPIALEVGTGFSNTQWTLSMARTNVANSATSEFFINLQNNASILDSTGAGTGYAVFGSVTTGTDVVSSIVSAPCTTIPGFITSSLGCVPMPNVVIATAVQTR
jgi:peptidyl-prolyl cis-trans isomerase A (cyclophilin A)